jgi:uncharacterized protein (DUF58 family)
MIPRELIRKIKRIEIYTNRLVADQLAGQYVSVFKGRGMAFEEVRQYMHGDDVRMIDWNVSARMNDTYVKLFVEEREMTVILIVDLSASGRFGTTADTKQEVMAELAAAIAFSAIKNNDRVGLILFSDRIEKYVPPKKGRKHVLRVVMEILNARPRGRGTDISAALDYLGKVTRHRAVVFLISDFVADGYDRSTKVAVAKHDLIPLCVTDPREETLPRIGTALVEDLETGELVLVDTDDAAVRRQYEQRVSALRADRERLWRRLRMDFVNVRTDAPDGHYEQALVRFFRRRAKRARRGGVS